MTVRNSSRGLSHLARSVTLVLCFLLKKNYQVLALRDYTVRNVQTSLLHNDTVRISWNVAEPRQPRSRWEVTHVTLQSINLTSSVRYIIKRDLYTVNYGIDENGMHRGTKYDVIIQLVDIAISPVSNKERGAVIIPPRNPVSFTATLSYHDLSRNGYPRFIEFNYHLQRRSLYSGVQIQCGNRSPDGTLSITFRENIDFEYSSKYENIALRRPTFMDSTRTTSVGLFLNSSYAVDGVIWLNANPAQTEIPLFFFGRWWTVELQQVFEIEKVIFYNHQSICKGGRVYCSTILGSLMIFSSRTFQQSPCSTTERSYRQTGPYEMVIVQRFTPTFSAKYVTICGYTGYDNPMTLLEVEVFTPEQPLIQTTVWRIQTEDLLPGSYVDCDVYTIRTIDGKSIKSSKLSLTQKFLPPPPPPRSMVYDYTEDGSHLILFDLEASAFDSYEYIQIAFLLDENLYTINNSLRFTHQGRLLLGKRYILETWTSTTLPVGKVKSLQNATFEFVAGGKIVTPKSTVTKLTQQPTETKFTSKVTLPRTTEPNTFAMPDNLTIALYALGIPSVLIFGSLAVVMIRKKVKQKLIEKKLNPMHSDLPPVHVYADLLPRDAVTEYANYSTTQYTTGNNGYIPDSKTLSSEKRGNIPLPSIPRTDRIQPVQEKVAPSSMITSQATDSAALPAAENMEYSTLPEPHHELGLYDSIEPRKKRKTKVKNNSK